jgi:predicted acyl esterase
VIEDGRSVRLRRGLHTTVGGKVVLGPTWETTVQKNEPAKMRDGATLMSDVYRPDRRDARFPASTFAHLYPTPQHVVLTRMRQAGAKGGFPAY